MASMAVALGPHLQQTKALGHQEQVGPKVVGLKELGAPKEEKQTEKNREIERGPEGLITSAITSAVV